MAMGDLTRPAVPTAMRDLLFELISELDHQNARRDSEPAAPHEEIQKTRIQIDRARQLLLERKSSEALEKLVGILAGSTGYVG